MNNTISNSAITLAKAIKALDKSLSLTKEALTQKHGESEADYLIARDMDDNYLETRQRLLELLAEDVIKDVA